jgi:hypothetical protein
MKTMESGYRRKSILPGSQVRAFHVKWQLAEPRPRGGAFVA